VAVIAVFLGFLMFAVHITINLYAESVVTAQAYDAVRHVARAGADAGPARADAEADLRDALGGYSSRIERLEWGGVEGEVVTLRVVATSPSFLVFTDADAIWTPGALTNLIGEMQRRGGDLQTVWPTQLTESWSERLVVPLMAFVVVGYLPLLAVHHVPWPIFAAAMGQCLAFRRSVYQAIGGHEAVRDRIVEDVAFAKRIKAAGYRLRVADGGMVILCRMYRNWRQVRNGFAKNVLAGHGDSIPFLLFSWVFHWLLWLLPWVWLAVGAAASTPWWPAWPLALVVLGVGIRALTAAFSRQRVYDALWMPVSTILMAIIATQAISWRLRHGGPQWSGRTLVKQPEPARRKG